MHALGLLLVTPYRNYFLADENKISADGIFVSPDVIVIISPSRRTASPLVTDCESEGVGLKARVREKRCRALGESRIHLANKRKITFFFVFLSIFTTFAKTKQLNIKRR